MDIQEIINSLPLRKPKPVPTVEEKVAELRQMPQIPYAVGEASTYGWGEKLNKHTASGEVFNPLGLTAAMWDVPLGTRAKVTDLNTGKQVIVTINDRGPNRRLNRPIDLSRGAWQVLGYKKAGLTNVKVELLK